MIFVSTIPLVLSLHKAKTPNRSSMQFNYRSILH